MSCRRSARFPCTGSSIMLAGWFLEYWWLAHSPNSCAGAEVGMTLGDAENPYTTGIDDNPFLDEMTGDIRLHRLMKRGKLGQFWERIDDYRERAEEPGELRALEYVEHHPEIFAEMIEELPEERSVAGFGLKFGEVEQRRSGRGLGVVTHWLTVCFVEVYPLRHYLVRCEEVEEPEFLGLIYGSGPVEERYEPKSEKGGCESGSGEGSVESSPEEKKNKWRRSSRQLALAAVVLGIALVFVVYDTITYEAEVQLINGFDESVEITFDGEESFEVAPRTQKPATISAGDRELSTRFVGGDWIEDLDVDVPRYKDLVVYNVAGAAPATVQSVTYFDTQSEEYWSEEYVEEVIFLAGQRFYSRDEVDYIDEEPPEEIETHRSADTATIKWALYYTGESPGWSLYQVMDHDPERLPTLLQRLLVLRPDNGVYHSHLRTYIARTINEGDVAVAREMLEDVADAFEDRPEDVVLHHLLIDLMREFGATIGMEPVADRYRSYHEEWDRVESALLFAAAGDELDEVGPLLDRVLEEANESEQLRALAHRRYAELHYDDGDCESAAPYFNARRLAVEQGGDELPIYYDPSAEIECLVELGRIERARELFGDSALEELETIDL